jgi:hypothetical protein
MSGLEELGRGLRYALQESDPDRELDSVERLTALAYLQGRGCAGLPTNAENHPRTIGGWLEWIAQYGAAG